MEAPVDQLNLGSGQQLSHGLRYKNLAWLGSGLDPLGEVNGNAGYIFTNQLNLTCVKSGANGKTRLLGGFD